MKPIEEFSQIEIAAFVQSCLAEKGIRVVLSGGAATAYYSLNRYVSADIDLVNVYMVRRELIRSVLNERGFVEVGRHFKHPDSPYLVEFPPGPLTVGVEPVKQVEEVELVSGILSVISATDCVKDRLAAFYHWGDQQCLYQATLIRNSVAIDLSEIERWSKGEGKDEEYQIFLKNKI